MLRLGILSLRNSRSSGHQREILHISLSHTGTSRTVWFRSEMSRAVWFRGETLRTVWFRSEMSRTVWFRGETLRTVWFRGETLRTLLVSELEVTYRFASILLLNAC